MLPGKVKTQRLSLLGLLAHQGYLAYWKPFLPVCWFHSFFLLHPHCFLLTVPKAQWVGKNILLLKPLSGRDKALSRRQLHKVLGKDILRLYAEGPCPKHADQERQSVRAGHLAPH